MTHDLHFTDADDWRTRPDPVRCVRCRESRDCCESRRAMTRKPCCSRCAHPVTETNPKD